jgi:diguanylate cyclase (GGDEF)-like protein
VCFRLLAFSAALENVIGVSILLIAVTFMLAGARKTIEKGFDLLRYQADHDPLTGLANRRVFDLDFLDVSDDAAGSRSLLLIDIDDFKAVNDTFGHGAGDALLNDLAACLRAVCRPADRIYRIGGDELAVLLVNCPPSVALARAETVRRAVEEMRSDADPRHELRTTVSIGFASAPLHGRRAIDLMRSADRALYEAKDAGRNLVRAGRPVALGLAMEG